MLTGATGSGKTTLLTQLSLDFAHQGIPTLWGSFELKNEIILSNMLHQLAGKDITTSESQFDYWADELNKLPIYFQTFFGSTELNKILNLIDYCIYAHDAAHIILDNLQFMLSGQGRGFERFELQDDLISKLRKIATERNVHITIVIHPKKTEEGLDLNVSSIFGTSKSTQEADNIYIIQNRKDFKVIDVKKNRFDGEIGKTALVFDKESKRFYDATKKDVEKIYNGTAVNDIITEKKQGFKLGESNIQDDNYEDGFLEEVIKTQSKTEYRTNGFGKDRDVLKPVGRGSDELSRHYKPSYPQRQHNYYEKDLQQSINQDKRYNHNLEQDYFNESLVKDSNIIEEEYFKIIEEEGTNDTANTGEHHQWVIDDKNEPNFFKDGDILYTYEDIIGEMGGNKNKGNKYENHRPKTAQDYLEDDILDNLNNRNRR